MERGMDKERFLRACSSVVGIGYARESIGLLAEKTMHAVIKEYMEEDHRFHEVRVGPFYADICRGDEIVEIQTRSLGRLRKKLDAFLPSYHVTVIYPIPAAKHLFWMDPQSGEILSGRRVSKKGSFYDAGRELWAISSYLGHPNLTVRLLLIDMEEYRLQNGYGKDKKRGSERYDRIPVALSDELVLDCPEDFEALFPMGLGEEFTVREFRKAVKGGPRTAPALLSVLVRMGIAEKTGACGRAFLYRRKSQ